MNRGSRIGPFRWHYIVPPPQVLRVILPRVWRIEMLRAFLMTGEGSSLVKNPRKARASAFTESPPPCIPIFSQTSVNSQKKVQSGLFCAWRIKGKDWSVVQRRTTSLPLAITGDSCAWWSVFWGPLAAAVVGEHRPQLLKDLRWALRRQSSLASAWIHPRSCSSGKDEDPTLKHLWGHQTNQGSSPRRFWISG